MRNLLTLTAVAVACNATGFAGPAARGDTTDLTLEVDTDRGGEELRSVLLTEARPELCRDLCGADEKCRAFTYLKPIDGNPARCSLKTSASAAMANGCCVSGAKGAVAIELALPAQPKGPTFQPSKLDYPATYPGATQQCTGTGTPGVNVIGYDGWPNAPIASTMICFSATSCITQHVPCWPFSCDPTAKVCTTRCVKDSECGVLARCHSNQCVPYQRTYCAGRMTIADLDGKATSSGAYMCDVRTGMPVTVCQNQLDCESHYSCNSLGQCVLSPNR